MPSVPPAPVLNRPVFNDAMSALAGGIKTEAGRFLAAFSYSGPTALVRVERNARTGARIYADRDYVFGDLPAALNGSDWVQTASADKLYSAVDLLDFSLKTDAVVYVAHDPRLPVPDWLQGRFSATKMTVAINGQRMNIYKRNVRGGDSLTLGSNTESQRVKSCNMYVVFVKGDESGLHARR
jgi:hypothetical protein